MVMMEEIEILCEQIEEKEKKRDLNRRRHKVQPHHQSSRTEDSEKGDELR